MEAKRKNENREIKINGSEEILDSIYSWNSLKLSRYSLLTLLPKNLFEQFHRISNIWFLLVSILQLIPFQLNPTDSWTTIAPLGVLLLFTLFKDFYCHYLIRKQEKTFNNRKYPVWNGEKFVNKQSKDLLVGQFVLVKENETIPVDMIIAASDRHKTVYLDMTNLLGFSITDTKEPIEKTSKILNFDAENPGFAKINGKLFLPEPNSDYNNVAGTLKLDKIPGAIEIESVNVLFQGGILKGDSSIIGLIMYCGSDTKIQLNTNQIQLKHSRLEKIVNIWVFYILLVLIGIIFFSVIGYYYIGTFNTSSYAVIEPTITFMLLYNNIIPISLFIVIDIIRLAQCWVFTRQFPDITFNTERVNENLGQVEYLLTDKTGSITDKKLKLKMCVIGDKKFEDQTETTQLENSENRNSIDLTYKQNFSALNFNDLKNSVLEESSLSLNSQFLKCLALCHNLHQHKDEFIGFPEEIALVKSAANFGFVLNIPENNIYEISKAGSNKDYYRIVASRPFNKEKQRLRILLEGSQASGTLYVKGSAEAILPLLDVDESVLSKIKENIEVMSSSGLRTMIFAYKKISTEEVLETKSKIQRIKKSLLNPESRIEGMFKELEKNLKFLGIAGLSENLLPGVAETLNSIKEAGIKIWMTSSDSLHNTKLIAKQAGFIDSDSKQLELVNLKSQISCCKALIKATKSLIFQETNIRLAPSEPNIMVKRPNKKGDYLFQEHETTNTDRYGIEFSDNILMKTKTKIDGKLNEILKKPFDPSDLDYSVIVDRVSFQTALKEADTRKLLTCILICAKSVCFVELMPRDKGNVVRLLKENVKFNPLVMGIGSSEGDINMIQTSDVGIGIRKDNHSLVLSYSDIVIKSFNQLEILALIEGHWQYTRLSKAILLFLYKNCFLTMIVFAYTFLCNYSGTSIFDAALLLGYNLFFTSLPILVIGICDEDVPYDKIVQSHKLYQVGINNMLFNRKKILSYLAAAVIQGIILVILIFVGFPYIVNPSGYTADFSYLGTVCYIALISAVLMQTFLDTFCYNLLYYFSHLVSVTILVVFIIILTYVDFKSTELYSVGTFISDSPIAFLTIIFSSILSILPNYFLSTYNGLFGVNAVDKFKENYSLTNVFVSKLEQFKNSLGSLYVNSSTWKNKIEDGKYSINKITLKFNLPHIEKKYKENYIRDFLPLFKWAFGFFTILVAISMVFQFLVFEENKIFAFLMIIYTFLCFAALCITYTSHFKKNYEFYILFFIGLCIVTRFAIYTPCGQPGVLASAIIPPFSFLILDVNWLMILILNALNLIMFIIGETTSYDNTYNSSENALLTVGNIVFVFAIYVTSARIGYFFEYSKRMGLKLLNNAHGGVEQIQSILSILLPKFVRTRVKEGIRYIAEDQGEVTIVFCDICDFDQICKDYNPQELTSFLDKLYSSFDDLCENLGVTKIETVGKTYMACSGLRDSDNDIPISLRNHPHARRGIELAFAIIQEVNSVQLKNGNTLQVKIGINSGTVAAGVVGHHKPQFSLVGDTVNTASRMCSTLDCANKIQISKATYDYISHYSDLEFTPKVVYAKGKGNIDVFVLAESKPDNSDIAGGFIKCNSNSNFYSANSFIPEASSSDDNNSKKATIKRTERTSKQWKETILKRRDSTVINYSPPLNIFAKISTQELEFRTTRLEKYYSSMFFALQVALVAMFLTLVFSICKFVVLTGHADWNMIICRTIVVVYLLVLVVLNSKIYKRRVYPYLNMVVLIFMHITVMLELANNPKVPIDYVALEEMYIILLLNQLTSVNLFYAILMNLIIFITWIAVALNTPDSAINIAKALIVAIFSLINFQAIYIKERYDRINHNLNWLADKEIKENETLLVQMMPPHVLEKLERGKNVTDRLMQVTLIFADIVGFTDWSSSKTPEEIVKMLSNLFTRFDKLCVEFDVYKVHTIGDCYVVMGDVGKKKRDPSRECLNIMKMAYRMIEVIKEENINHHSSLDMRIGVHTGQVIAGIIGTKIVRYDIYGPDVLIANKMESNGLPGRVKISQDTKEMIENRNSHLFAYEESNKIEIPAIDAVKQSYFVECLDPDSLFNMDLKEDIE